MAKVFTKRNLVDAIAKETGVRKNIIKSIFITTSKIVKKQLTAGYKVCTQNGTIKVEIKKARTGVNPQNGKKITIPACKKPKFTFSKEFKEGF